MVKLPEIPKGFVKVAVHTRFAHSVLMAAVVFLIGMFAVLQPMRGFLGKRQDYVFKVQQRLQRVESFDEGSGNFDIVLGRLRNELNDLNRRVLRTGEQAKVISILTKKTEDLGITILNIKPVPVTSVSEDPKPKRMKASLFELEMVCRYKTLGVFLEELAKAPLILTIENFEAEPAADRSPLLNISMTVAAYEQTT